MPVDVLPKSLAFMIVLNAHPNKRPSKQLRLLDISRKRLDYQPKAPLITLTY
jgi:hypothetical protein